MIFLHGCANRAIGCIGLMLTGDVTGIFEADCWSVRNMDGARTYGVDAMDKPADLSEVVDMLDRHVAIGSRYAEFWIRNPVITGYGSRRASLSLSVVSRTGSHGSIACRATSCHAVTSVTANCAMP